MLFILQRFFHRLSMAAPLLSLFLRMYVSITYKTQMPHNTHNHFLKENLLFPCFLYFYVLFHKISFLFFIRSSRFVFSPFSIVLHLICFSIQLSYAFLMLSNHLSFSLFTFFSYNNISLTNVFR